MKIFPKCLIGKSPQVTYNGYVLPCCWMPYTEKIYFEDGFTKNNPFLRDDFNLYNNEFNDIVGSEEWMNLINEVFHADALPHKCSVACKTFNLDNGKAVTSNSRQPKIYYGESSISEFWNNQSTNYEIFKKSFIHPREITELNLETTSRCSLQCPYCSRTVEKDTYKKDDLSLDIVEKLLSARNWETVVDCPRYGDPIFYKYFNDMLSIMKHSSVKNYRIHVAATGKGFEWWDTTINQFLELKNNNINVTVTFGVDGLEDTSKIHRIGQNWAEILYAMKNCSLAGINTVWQFIPFKHNEHQIDEAKELANSLNVRFKLVVSNRFKVNDPMKPANPDYSSCK